MFASCYQVTFRILLLLVSCLLLTVPGQAETLADLYSADVDGSLPRERQIEQALDQVLVKLSGRPAVVQLPEVAVMKDNAPLLIRTVETEGTRTQISFEPQSVSRLMQSLGLPLLPEPRPEVLVWLGQEGSDAVVFVEPGTEPYQMLAEGAMQRGLPLQVPLLDLEDQLALSTDQLASGAQEVIQHAASRYQPDAVLVGIRRGEQVAWTLWYHGQRYDERSGTDRQALQQLIGRVADRVFGLEQQAGSGQTQQTNQADQASQASRAEQTTPTDPAASMTYVPQPVEVGPFQPDGQLLLIEGVNNTADYLAVTAALRQLNGVETVVSAGQQAGALRLIVRVAPQTRLDAVLRQEPRLMAEGSQRYRWTGQ